MDRRETMPMLGSAPVYMQRQMSELHGSQGVVHSSPNGSPFQQGHMMGNSTGGAGLLVDSSTGALPDGVGVVVGPTSMQPSAMPLRRKRGRPRKYGPDGGRVSLGLSSLSTTSRGMNALSEKRGRGRPPGTGRKQLVVPFGRLVSGSAGVSFTPHVITAVTGEDISAKILAFAQQGPRAICILSANGAVSTATLQQPSTSSGTVTYEGRYDIVCMSGSFLLIGNDISNERSGGLTISLASPDGRVIGGAVGGMVIAATPVQVIVGSFIWSTPFTNQMIQERTDDGGDSQHHSVDSNRSAPLTSRPSQNMMTTLSMGGWQTLDIRNLHVDIDLMRG